MFTADKRQGSLTPALRSLAPLCLGGCSRAGESLEAGTRSISTSSSITPLSWGARLPASLLVPGEMTAIMSPTDESSAGQNNTEMQLHTDTHTHTGSHQSEDGLFLFLLFVFRRIAVDILLITNKSKLTIRFIIIRSHVQLSLHIYTHTETHTQTRAVCGWALGIGPPI